jgi:HrpA-like RNA helicase
MKLQALKIPGTKDEDSSSDSDASTKTKKSRSKRPLTDYEKKRKNIDETKKSLPVYPFREQLLEAIAEHQVIKSLLKCNSKHFTLKPF